MTGTELCFITLAEGARRIARHELSPVELTEAYLQRIGAFDRQLQSFVTLTADLALRQAAAAEAEIMRAGPGMKVATFAAVSGSVTTCTPVTCSR